MKWNSCVHQPKTKAVCKFHKNIHDSPADAILNYSLEDSDVNFKLCVARNLMGSNTLQLLNSGSEYNLWDIDGSYIVTFSALNNMILLWSHATCS